MEWASGVSQIVYLLAHVWLTASIALQFSKYRPARAMYRRLALAGAAAVLCAEAAVAVTILDPREIAYFLGLRILLAVRLALFAVVGAECSLSLDLQPIGFASMGERRRTGRALLIAMACGAGFAGYTHALFGLTSASYETGTMSWHRWVSNVAISPFAEEIIYRLGIQNFLATRLSRRGFPYFTAIIATSVLFSMGHVGSMQAPWVKVAQMLPISLVLGMMYKRFGFESCWVAHTLFNGLVWADAMEG